VGFLSELHAKRIDLYVHQQGLDTSTPAGKAMFQMLGVFAEFERGMIRERVRAGMVRARATGTKSGRAIGRPALAEATTARIADLLGASQSESAIVTELGVGKGTVGRVRAGLGAR
jgi:DNA invertase Pin-like site-specific DNA recombinase